MNGGDDISPKLSKRAHKYLEAQDKPARERLKSAIAGLAASPPLGDIVSIVNHPPFKRLRVGDLRVIFWDNEGIIEVVRIAPRGQVYDSL